MIEYKLEKVKDREDISLYRATLENGNTIDIEANTKADAVKKLEEYLETDSAKMFNAPSTVPSEG